MSEFDPRKHGDFGLDVLTLKGRLQISIAHEVLAVTGMNRDLEGMLEPMLNATQASPGEPHQTYLLFHWSGEGVAVMRSNLLLGAMMVEQDPSHREDFRIAAAGLSHVLDAANEPR